MFEEKVAELINCGKTTEAINFIKSEIANLTLMLSGVYYEKKKDIAAAKNALKVGMGISNDPALKSNLAFLYSSEREYEAAVAALSGVEGPFDVHYNRGIALKQLHRLEDARKEFETALQKKPESSITHCHLASILFALGDYKRAYEEEQWRFKAFSRYKYYKYHFLGEDWQGQEIAGKHLIVFNEQGLGDTIQNLRYMESLKALTKAKITLECSSSLHGLLKGFPGIDELAEMDQEEPIRGDYLVSMNSLPLYLDPHLRNTHVKPYLQRAARNIEFMAHFKENYKIGIVWCGSSGNDLDRIRSCYLKHFAVLCEIPNVQLFSLQKGSSERLWSSSTLYDPNDEGVVVDLKDGSEKVNYVDLEPMLDTFADTADLINQMDLIITVDTSVAHLAGAMGKKTYLLLPYYYDWRWNKEWYDNFKIIRQQTPGDWTGLFSLVAAATVAAQQAGETTV